MTRNSRARTAPAGAYGRAACLALALVACGAGHVARTGAEGADGADGAASARSPDAAHPRPAHHDALARELDALLERAAPAIGGASLLVVRGDTVLYDRSIGAIAPGTAIPVASAAKWTSGALLAALVSEGRLAFDDSLGRWLDAGSPMARGIRIGHLFSHTSGFPRSATCVSDPRARLAACAREIVEGGLLSRPGERFTYGGASMHVAARVAELAGGASWRELFASRIARPLGLEATRYLGAIPHVAGGLVSTRDDYARVLRLLLDSGRVAGRQVIAAAAVAAMERDWARGAAVVPPPRASDVGYGIGMWIDRADSLGRAVELSSPGAYGFTPWIDRERNLLGVLAIRTEGGEEGFALAAAVRAEVRSTVRPAAVGRSLGHAHPRSRGGGELPGRPESLALRP